MQEHLHGRIALVTGASTGIGAEIARALLDAGAEVHGVARRKELVADVLGAEVVAAGRGMAYGVDLSDPAQLDKLCDSLDGIRPDIVVCAAGRNMTGRRFDQLTQESWEAVRNLNLDSIVHLLRRTIPAMRGRGGDVILIASVSAQWPDHAGPAYAATKAALVALGRGISRDEHAHGVRVTSVLPGLVDTPLIDRRPVPPPPELRRWCLKPEDVAAAVLAAVSLPPRAHIPEMTIVATRLQSMGGTQESSPELPEGLEGMPTERFAAKEQH
ncbi:SDR family oxidoreductase [Arthrobacter sp. TB 23]|uniref:SDR family oxidoreductase n=1 Tax=Arthrobacter sp. TB 23 TaxID=494419 RepID=UPI00030773D2|nr:SDR family oxidoreductase [Arthrobacter sp. TB 23]